MDKHPGKHPNQLTIQLLNWGFILLGIRACLSSMVEQLIHLLPSTTLFSVMASVAVVNAPAATTAIIYRKSIVVPAKISGYRSLSIRTVQFFKILKSTSFL